MKINKISKIVHQLFTTSRLFLSIGLFLISLITFYRIAHSNIATFTLSILVALITYLVFNFKHLPSAKEINLSQVSPWTITLSALVGSFSLLYTLENSSFVLKDFAQRAIGITILEGIDASARSWFYIILIVLFIVVFSLSFYVYSKIDLVLLGYLKREGTKNERKMLFSLSLLSIFALIFHYLTGAIIYANIFDLLLFLILLTYLVLLAKGCFKEKNELFFSLLNNYNLIILSFLIPPVIFFIRWIFIKGTFTFNYKYFYPFIFLWAVFWLFIYLFAKFWSLKNRQRVISALLAAAIPFLLIPISIPISNEIQFSLSGSYKISVYSVSIVSMSFLLGVAAFIFVQKLRHLKYQSLTSFAASYYLPILIASVVMSNQNVNFIEIPNYFDLFHQGENLLATQQLFSFKSIPFINIYPTHGISYMVGQVLYSLLNGYRAFEPWLWEWLTKIFEVLLLYFVLKKLTNSFFATIVILFTPLIGIFGGYRFIYGYNTSLVSTYYLAAFSSALSLVWLLKKPNLARLTIHWMTCLFLVIWRVDFGLACLTTTSFILFVLLLNKKLNGSKTLLKLKEVVLSVILTGILFLFLGIFLSLVGEESFLKILSQNLEFLRFQASTQGLISIADWFSPLAIFQYFALPSISVFYILFFIFNFFRKRLDHFGTSRWLLLFLAIFSLIISVRSVQRQTLAILGYNPYLFVFLGVCIPFYLKIFNKGLSATLFVAMLLAYLSIFPNNILLIKTGPLVNLYNWKNKESRVRINDYQYKKVASFLNDNLNSSQTFLDLANSPMLYIATNKKFVNYFMTSTYYTSEPIQKFTLERLRRAYENNEIPIVIFRQPDSFANNIDGVPNEIRSYRIYEFVYKNYKPAGYIDGYMIWLAASYSLPRQAGLIPIKTFSQDFDLKKLPYIWGTYDEYKAKENTAIIASLIKEPKIIYPEDSVELSFDKNIDKSSGNYIHLKIRTNEPGTLKLTYGKNPFSSVNMNLLATGKEEDYLIRVSSQWAWMSESFDLINLSTTAKVEVVKIFIRKGD